ncbi:unnamed protein product [Protopolystoma xenopodis]|uniref:Uncharacterized protein n=1 Tax=Protopolystoma xenopodis TaxID=117903 RepID=A0A3S5A9L2_9PLAT|nr:unnamed protein product [Protopolystoma xenopodis]
MDHLLCVRAILPSPASCKMLPLASQLVSGSTQSVNQKRGCCEVQHSMASNNQLVRLSHYYDSGDLTTLWSGGFQIDLPEQQSFFLMIRLPGTSLTPLPLSSNSGRLSASTELFNSMPDRLFLFVSICLQGATFYVIIQVLYMQPQNSNYLTYYSLDDLQYLLLMHLSPSLDIVPATYLFIYQGI